MASPNRLRARLLLVAAALTAISAVPAVAADLGLRRQADDLYLVAGRQRLLLHQAEWVPSSLASRPLRLPGGYLATLDTATAYRPAQRLTVLRNGKPWGLIDTSAIREEWLRDDRFWASHEEANEMRYLRQRGGLSVFITNPMVVGRSLLALLSWQADGPSARPMVAQFLVRMEVAPAPKLAPVRRLDLPQDATAYNMRWYHVPRLFRYGKLLLLYLKPGPVEPTPQAPSPAELVAIDSDGMPTWAFAQIPPSHYPLGLLDDRWLILGRPFEKEPQPLRVLDLRTRRQWPLPGDWRGFYDPMNVYVPKEGGRILVYQYWRKSEATLLHKTWIVAIPGGTRIGLPNPSGTVRQYLWQNLAVLVDDQSVSVYRAQTGKRLRSLRYR